MVEYTDFVYFDKKHRDILNELVNERLARFVGQVDPNNLSAENKEQWEQFLEDPNNIGYLIA